MELNIAKASSLANCVGYDNNNFDLNDLMETKQEITILGKLFKVNSERDIEKIKSDIYTRIWLTYRKNFMPIGDPSGPTSDAGWGCMLRCGQMMLAQALIVRHLGRNWRYTPNNEIYYKIMKLFEDKKSAPYSIHQIASMGVTEGKDIGQWFGPGMVSHVLKKLSAYEYETLWTDIALHVAMDSTIVIDDLIQMSSFIKPSLKKETLCATSVTENIILRVENNWKPVLLFIPLRLGLTELNPIYVEPLKRAFECPNCVGVLGGRPNHAYWFIGFIQDYFIYLDPHTNQPFHDLNDFEDSSYHCKDPGKLFITDIDPSMAIGFLFQSRQELDEFQLYSSNNFKLLFEIVEKRPKHWPNLKHFSPFNVDDNEHDFIILERKFDSDEDFELL